MTTKDAFYSVLNSKAAALIIKDANQMEISTLRQRAKEDGISERKMEEILTRAGYRVIQEEMWVKTRTIINDSKSAPTTKKTSLPEGRGQQA